MTGRALRTIGVLAIASVLLGELALRVIGLGDPPIAIRDTELEYRLKPDASYTRWGNLIEIGSHGFRGPTLADEPGSNEVRLLLIGDSVVYGNHFLDQSETIALRLSAMLSTESCTVQVVPMAVSSWGPVNQAAALKRHGDFGAEAVAIVLSAHDLFDIPQPEGSLVPYRLSRPIGAIGDAVEAVLERYFPPARPSFNVSSEARREMTLTALDEIAETTRRSGQDLLMVYNATTFERDAGRLDQGQVLMDWAQERAVASLDLGMVPGIGYRDHIHPNAEGAHSIAQVLADKYRGRLVCDGG